MSTKTIERAVAVTVWQLRKTDKLKAVASVLQYIVDFDLAVKSAEVRAEQAAFIKRREDARKEKREFVEEISLSSYHYSDAYLTLRAAAALALEVINEEAT